MKTFYQPGNYPGTLNFLLHSVQRQSKYLLAILLLIPGVFFGQTTYNFSTAPVLSNQGNFYTIQALASIDGVSYKITHMGNGNFSNLANGGNSNSACLKKDGSGGDFLKIERADGAAFQFYGMWLNTSSMYSPPFYQPPYYNIKYYDQNNAEITAETFTSSVQNETITVSKNLKVKYVQVNFNAILFCKIDDLIVGPAAASVPTVSTSSINQFTSSAALVGGNVTDDGGAPVSERGIVYNTTGTPTTADNKITIGSGTGAFSQHINGLNSNTIYYVRSYAINSAGTAYGAQQSFTTAADFVLAQTHYFNTAWVNTTSQASPFTKYVEGWHITATGTGTGLVSIIRITGVTGLAAAGEGVASARAISITGTENLVSVSVKANDNSLFDLQSFKFKYLTKVANTSFGTITVTGYHNGVAVPGAVASLNGISQATASSYAYSTFDLTGNASFNGIDEFVITAADPVNSARLSAIDLDELNIAPYTVLPLTLTSFAGRLANNQAVFSWITQQEQAVSHFDMEHSTDGTAFTKIGRITAAGTSAGNKTYTFTHNAVAAGNNYYRLRIADRDGKFAHSAVVTITGVHNKEMVTVYPNPVTGDHCFITVAPGTPLPLSYRIVDAHGKAVQTGSITGNKQRLNLSQLSRGNYFILLHNGASQKIIL
jgi:hypothetical protein